MNADGGAWIKAGKNRIAGITYVLDEFHLNKYILRTTSHMLDSQGDAAKAIKETIKDGTKADFEVLEYAETEACAKRILETKEYILSNWIAAKIRLRDRETVIGSSTECHVSHVLSSRMSSRPMEWSRTGCDKMSHLRAYYMNKGDMLELVRSQPKVLAKAVGAESDYEVLSMAKQFWFQKKVRSIYELEKNTCAYLPNDLSEISYHSQLGKSLKNTLRKFNKEDLFQEINDLIFYLAENEDKIAHEHRIKSLQSCNLKYEKNYPSTEVEKTFNDILGIRIIVDDYSIVDDIKLPNCVKIADMRNGKANDDGYRAIHMYYQKDHYHYPIEI